MKGNKDNREGKKEGRTNTKEGKYDISSKQLFFELFPFFFSKSFVRKIETVRIISGGNANTAQKIAVRNVVTVRIISDNKHQSSARYNPVVTPIDQK